MRGYGLPCTSLALGWVLALAISGAIARPLHAARVRRGAVQKKTAAVLAKQLGLLYEPTAAADRKARAVSYWREINAHDAAGDLGIDTAGACGDNPACPSPSLNAETIEFLCNSPSFFVLVGGQRVPYFEACKSTCGICVTAETTTLQPGPAAEPTTATPTAEPTTAKPTAEPTTAKPTAAPTGFPSPNPTISAADAAAAAGDQLIVRHPDTQEPSDSSRGQIPLDDEEPLGEDEEWYYDYEYYYYYDYEDV